MSQNLSHLKMKDINDAIQSLTRYVGEESDIIAFSVEDSNDDYKIKIRYNAGEKDKVAGVRLTKEAGGGRIIV